MKNNAAQLELLKADWEAKRIAFEVACSSPFGVLPYLPVQVPTNVDIQPSLDFVPGVEDPPIAALSPLP